MTTNEKKNINVNETTESEKSVKKMNKKSVGLIAGATVTVAAVLISMLCLSACNDKKPVATADEVVIGTSVQTVTQVVTDAQGNTHIEEETKVVEVKQTQPAEKSEKATEANAENMAKTDNKQNNGGQSNNSGNSNQTNNNNNNAGNGQTSKSNGSSGQTSKPSGGTSSSSSSSQSKPSSSSSSSSSGSSSSAGSSSSKPEQPTTKDPHEGKTWHEAEYKTEQVWVVDEEGYTWQKPIVEGQWRTICNICGADITEDVTGHDKTYHLPYGDDFSYSDKWIEQITGYETIKVPEKGHYETKTTLVREAGWY